MSFIIKSSNKKNKEKKKKNRNRQSTDKKQRKATKSLFIESFEPFIMRKNKKGAQTELLLFQEKRSRLYVHDIPCECHLIINDRSMKIFFLVLF